MRFGNKPLSNKREKVREVIIGIYARKHSCNSCCPNLIELLQNECIPTQRDGTDVGSLLNSKPYWFRVSTVEEDTIAFGIESLSTAGQSPGM
eukprot:scaffold116_cov334-Pavlova_lutheri.AAC.2